MNVPPFDVLKALKSAVSASEVVKGVKAAKAAFDLLTAPPSQRKKAGFRSLTSAQVRQLKQQGNTAQDWKEIFVQGGFDAGRVHRCHFIGPNLIGAMSGEVKLKGVPFPAGLQDATLAWCLVGKNALIRNVRLVSRSVIGEGAVLFDVGALTLQQSDSFGNGLEALIAIETGGREILLFSELTVEGAWVIARCRGNAELLKAYGKGIEVYTQAVSSPCNLIGNQARILHTPCVEGVFLGSGAVIENAVSVSHATLLSSPEERSEISHGAIVKSSILQWGAQVTSGAIVEASLLTEHSHVERHGKVTHSILGPNTGVAEGEVTSALLGPFVGFHHQALLIAALWPEGKGNVGYGANIGSNHTAKAPDQEIWPGEGTFFGLGVNIKFPTDLTGSPYTIIASAVNMLPQRVEFPFSLINTPAASYPGISPAYNEIMPGWVLSDNIYMVKRNEGKYAKRNKAKRSRFDFEVFRPEIVDGMVDARRRLAAASGKEIYTSKDVKGLGKNYMSEANRKRAIQIYTFYIRYYALLGLKRELEGLAVKKASDGLKAAAQDLLKEESSNLRWEHERKLLLEEFEGVELGKMLKELVQMQEKIAGQVQGSKEKDDHRGAEVIADYSEAHPPASQDSFVKETWGFTEQLKKQVDSLLARIDRSLVSK